MAKKKKQTYAEFMKEYYGVGDDIAPVKSEKATEDIAPVKTTTERKYAKGGSDFDGNNKVSEGNTKKRTWFNTSAFDDGYQLFDVSKSIGATIGDIAENIIVGGGELAERGLEGTAAFLSAMFEAQQLQNSATEMAYKEMKGEDSTELLKSRMNPVEAVKEKTAAFVAEDSWNSEKAVKESAKKILGVDLDEYSFTGEKLDSALQSIPQVAASASAKAVGVPWFLVSGMTAYGGELENALNQGGASWEEANISAGVSASGEILTEMLSGGISFGGKTLDDVLTKQVATKIANKFWQKAAQFGLDVTGEAAEEWISADIGAFGQWLTYRSEEELLDLLTSEEAMDAKIEAAIGGGLLGGVSNIGKAVKSKVKGVDSVTGLTKNEQKIFDKVAKEKIAEKENGGKKLTVNEKAKIRSEVMEDLKEGGISTDTIAEVLGGESYKAYQDAIEKDNQAIAELEGIYEGEELNKAKEEILKNSERESLKAKMNEDVFKAVKGSNDQFLVESYNEVARKKQDFEADLTKYDEKQQKVIKNAIDAGILNNTNRTHKLVDWIAKISADKGIDFDFANNKKLQELGYAVEGKTVNGVEDNGKITLNLESAKAISFTVGHEITHVLEGTELYDSLQETLFKYAKVKGEYETRLREAMNLYKGVKGYEGANGVAKIKKEVAADLVGDYLFTDKDFVRNLHAENRNVFQKVWDEIKYLYKIATAGSQEARELAKLQKVFEDVYRESVKTEGDGEVKYSLSSMANTFFGDPNMSASEFAKMDYKQTEGYKSYVDQCIENMRQTRTDFDEATARAEIEKSIDGIVGVAIAAKKAGYDIYDDAERRDVKDSKNRLLFSSLEPNSDYFTSNDISTICDKRKNFAEIYDDIVRAEEAKGVPEGKRFFKNVDNYFFLHNLMAEKGLTQPCRQCYVESMRKNLAPMANAFLELVNETNVNNKKNKQLYNGKGNLKSNNAKLREKILQTFEEHPEYGMTAWDLTVETLTTADGLAQLKIQAPLIYEAFNSFYGQSKPKMPKSATPFRFGELTALLTDHNGKIKQSLVDKINSTGGFRLQSYSDFQIQNYTDVLQVIFEAGTLGLNGHAYTKVPAFLEATENTNLKRNISIFMYKDGNEWKIDKNDSFPGTLEEIYDLVKADKSGNTSIIAVSQNAEMSAWIMANDLVGYGIPFHKSGMKMGTVRDTDVKTEDGRVVKGYAETKDHTKEQTEVWAKTTADHKAQTKVKKGIDIYSFWDFDNKQNISKNELIEKNVKRYIDECEKAGYLPKFRNYVMNNSKVLSDVLRFSKEMGYASPNATISDIAFEYKGYVIPYGYYKFLGDFGMFTPDGKASPHKPLSLDNYDFDKAEQFFENSEELRRNEILQQFANDGERELYRNSGFNAEELAEIAKRKRDEIVESVVDGKYSLSEENAPSKKYGDFNTPANEMLLERDIAPTKEDLAKSIDAPIRKDVAKPTYNVPNSAPMTEADMAAFDQERLASLDDADAPEEVYADGSVPRETAQLPKTKVVEISKHLREKLGLSNRQMAMARGLIEVYSKNDALSRDDLYETIKAAFGTQTKADDYVALRNEARQFIRNLKINVPKEFQSDIQDFAYKRKLMSRKIKFSEDGQGIDELYKNDLQPNFPKLFGDETQGDAEKFDELYDVLTNDGTEDVDLPEETLQSAADIIVNEVADYRNKVVQKLSESASRQPIDQREIPVTEEEYNARVDKLFDSLVNKPIGRMQKVGGYSFFVSRDDFGGSASFVIKTKDGNTIRKTIENASGMTDAQLWDAAAEMAVNTEMPYIMDGQSVTPARKEYDPVASRLRRSIDRIDKQLETDKANLEEEFAMRREGADGTSQRSLDREFEKRLAELETEAETKRQNAMTGIQRIAKSDEHTELAKKTIGDTSTWKDKKTGLGYKINTFRRYMRDIVRDANGNKDYRRADAIDDEYAGKYNLHEAEANREGNRIKKPFAEMKITKAESKYIQMLGEFRHNPETTLTEEQVKDYLNKHKNSIDEAKVDKAIALARETYDELIDRVNAVLREQGMKEIPYRKGYFPHFNEETPNWFQKGLEIVLNWKTQNHKIPTSIAGITEQFKPARSWQSFNKQRTGDRTEYNFLKGFDNYVSGAMDWIYHIDDIQKHRALENYIRYTHSDEGVKAEIDKIRANDSLGADEAQTLIDAVYKESENPLGNLVVELRARTNAMANKKSSLDRTVEEMVNRDVYSTLTNINNRVSANAVVANISSAISNIIAITQSWVEVSPLRSLQAMKMLFNNTIHDDGLIDKSAFLTNRLRPMEKLYKTGWDKVGDVGGVLMNIVDNISSQVVWRSKYIDNISNGMNEVDAIKNADQFAKNVIGGRSKGDMPTLFESKNLITKLFTTFQLEVNNQYGYMFKDAPIDSDSKGRLVAGYATAFIGAYLYNALASSLTGRDVAFDPIGIIEDLLKDLGILGGDEEEEEKDVLGATVDFAENVIQEAPFVGGFLGGGRIPISSALPYDANLMDMIEGTGNAFKGENVEAATKEWLKPLYYLAMPMGGGQLKKTVEGLKMFSEDHPVAGSYTNSGDLRFPVDDTFGNRVKAGVFGQYSSKNAREYFDNDYAPLNPKQVKEYMDLDAPIADYWKYREGLKGLKKLEEKADYINGLDFTTEQKNLLINNIADRKEDIDMTDYDAYDGFEEFDYAHKNPEKYAISTAVGGYESFKGYTKTLNKIKADKDKNGDAIDGSRKKKVTAYIQSLNIDRGQKLILHKSEYPSDTQYNREIIAYLKSRKDLSDADRKKILEALGFKVEGNTVRW